MPLQFKTKKKLLEAFGKYSNTDSPLLDRLFSNEIINISDLANKIEKILNKCNNLALENRHALFVLFQLKLSLEHTDYSESTNKEYIITLHKQLDEFFRKDHFTNMEILFAMKANLQPLKFIFGNDIIQIIYSKEVQEINRYTRQLKKEIKDNYSFIDSVDYIQLGNTFKSQSLNILIHSIKNFIKDEADELKAVKEFKTKKNSILQISALSNAMEDLTKNHLDVEKMSLLKLDDLEYINIQDLILSGILNFNLLEDLTTQIKSCFKFKETNKKGITKLLYPLFQVFWNDQKTTFLSHEQWKETRIKEQMDDIKTWRLYQLRQVSKKISIDQLFE